MNVTHNNEAGREAVAAGGGPEALAQLVARCAVPVLQAGTELMAAQCHRSRLLMSPGAATAVL